MNENVSVTQEYFDFQYVGTPDYHHGKKLLAYTLSKADAENRFYRQQIILKHTITNHCEIITAGGTVEKHPRFSTDGSKLLFVSNLTGEDQLYVSDIVSKEVTCVSTMRFGVSEPVWSPNGKYIAFLSSCDTTADQESLQNPLTEAERKELQEKQLKEAVVITDYGYKSDEAMGFCIKKSTQLWVLALGEKKARKLSDGDRDYVMPVWSPDSETIVFVSNRCRPREESIGMDLFSVSKNGGGIKKLTDGLWIAYYPAKFSPMFTKDGKEIICGAMVPGEGGGMPLTRLYRVTLDGDEAINLWDEKALCHEATCFFYNSENYGGVYENATLSSDGNHVFFISGWHGSADIYKAAVYGDPHIERLTHGEHNIKQIGKAQNGCFIVLKGDFLDTPQVYLLQESDADEQKLTDTAGWLRTKPLSKPQEMWIETLDGETRVQGWVIPPQNAAAGKKYPAVLYIHGGPTPFYGYGLCYEHQCIAGAGIGIIMCNPRGSTGYGEEHASAKKAFDGTAMTDLLQFVDESVRQFDWIDKDKLGVTGGSYGGYMTNWIVTHAKKFKAAVTQRSISNNLIGYASSDMAGSSKGNESFQDFMMQNIKESPVAYAEKIDVPFLILHSLNDMRTPVEHAHQLYTAVKDTHPDLPVRMVLFPKSNHSLTMNGRMDLRVAHYNETINWFKKYL